MAAITVKKLIETLSALPQDAIVVLSSDEEGNGFSPISEEGSYSLGIYTPDTTWSGEFSTEEDAEDGGDEFEYDADPNAVVAVCLWPTN